MRQNVPLSCWDERLWRRKLTFQARSPTITSDHQLLERRRPAARGGSPAPPQGLSRFQPVSLLILNFCKYKRCRFQRKRAKQQICQLSETSALVWILSSASSLIKAPLGLSLNHRPPPAAPPASTHQPQRPPALDRPLEVPPDIRLMVPQSFILMEKLWFSKFLSES